MSYFPRLTTAVEVAAALKEHIVGKNILITGVSPKSIGTETVRALAPYAKTIIAASRSVERIQEALQPVFEATPSANIKAIALDLASEKSIRAAAEEVLALGIPIDVVINNAAGPQAPTLTRTQEGFEAQIGAGHLGHFLFNSRIFSTLRAAVKANGSARVVPIASRATWMTGDIRIDDLNYELRPEEYQKIPAYGKTKTANILYARELAKRFKGEGILAISLHPGAIRETNMGGAVTQDDWVSMGLYKSDGTVVSKDAFKNIAQGTSTTIVAAFQPELVDHSGAFLSDCALGDAGLPAWATDDVMAEKLWDLSESLWKIKFGQDAKASL